jgi:hypothetical protein
MTTPLRIDYDEEEDVVTINGVQYTGNFFRFFTHGLKQGTLLRVLKKNDKMYVEEVCLDGDLFYSTEDSREIL